MGWQDMFPRDTAAKNERGAIHPCFNQMPKSAESSPKLFARSSQEALTLDKFLATGWGRTARIETSSNFFSACFNKTIIWAPAWNQRTFFQPIEGGASRAAMLVRNRKTTKHNNKTGYSNMFVCLWIPFALSFALCSSLKPILDSLPQVSLTVQCGSCFTMGRLL